MKEEVTFYINFLKIEPLKLKNSKIEPEKWNYWIKKYIKKPKI